MHLLEPTALRSGTPRHRPRQVDERLTGTPATACQAPASAKCGLVDLQAVRTTATTQDHGGQVGGRVRTLPIRMQPDEPSKVHRWDRSRAPFSEQSATKLCRFYADERRSRCRNGTSTPQIDKILQIIYADFMPMGLASGRHLSSFGCMELQVSRTRTI